MEGGISYILKRDKGDMNTEIGLKILNINDGTEFTC